ncbi:hypothetical protein [Emticicia sp. TH156]|uniref:hypothetical protein n=1 Tax=Emticicia sp. TH156 TaxID=2067454 RepID=UPI000C776EF5|nr:hypothetical protein [Emticicia sp. TH156]PLK43909.1 hypothetical protein C0V77_12205 [Emticicia sp. TH156]
MFYILSVCLAFSERTFETYKVKEHNLRTSCRCVEKPNATAINQAYPTLVTQENHYDPWGVGIDREVVADTSKLPKFELKDRFT